MNRKKGFLNLGYLIRHTERTMTICSICAKDKDSMTAPSCCSCHQYEDKSICIDCTTRICHSPVSTRDLIFQCPYCRAVLSIQPDASEPWMSTQLWRKYVKVLRLKLRPRRRLDLGIQHRPSFHNFM